MLSTPFILFLGIAAVSPMFSPPRASEESQSPQVTQRPQMTQGPEVTPTAYPFYSGDDDEYYGMTDNMVEETEHPEDSPRASRQYFGHNYAENEKAKKAYAAELKIKKFQDWLASVPSWIDEFWSANLDDDANFQKAKPVIATLWNTIQQFNLPFNDHLMDYDLDAYGNLVGLVRNSLEDVGVWTSTIEIHDVFTEYVLMGRHFNHGIFDLDLLEHCFVHIIAASEAKRQIYISDQSGDEDDDEIAKFTNEEFEIVGKAIEDWQQSSDSTLSSTQPEKLMSGIIQLWRMMASRVNLHAEYNNAPDGRSEEYSNLVHRFLRCGRQMGFWMDTDNADEFFFTFLFSTNQMDATDVNLEYFARFFFKELESRKAERKIYEGSETDESSM
ncbi:hypothetical protein NEOLI_000578 [Neolecta irregularis DAH-3]|uniref:Uncharacterized protein n=1 Tax=Neolecta irregularis (strain DAH-3) TaxID=1198029 RepID=A0A1U7LKH6_NEOID|nr:hypothetical protein NEOLI_000578 [Neolecta irregularis DAH-3]|eukprot:OLL23154.1 hypothetical protein NEOLI_000578 [Neolecta irregularis DAH-3]